jgi:hypothetical protein
MTDEYPRVRPAVIRARASQMVVWATLIDAGSAPPAEEIRMAACEMYAAAEDLEDVRRVRTAREYAR